MNYEEKVKAVIKELDWMKSMPSNPVSTEEWAKRILTSIGIKGRKLDEKEIANGRSEGYWDMDPRDQWAEDKRLGILDWDGN